jgi:hypothetical protein
MESHFIESCIGLASLASFALAAEQPMGVLNFSAEQGLHMSPSLALINPSKTAKTCG